MNEEVKKDYGILVAKKSEKLVTALYLVTDLIDDTEPIKQGLRKNAVCLLSSMNSLAQMDVKDKMMELKTSLKLVTEILSLLQVSVTSGTVSEMNGNILMDGFRSLQLVLEKKQPVLSKEMLIIADEDYLNNETTTSNVISKTSYDAITPLALVRAKDNKMGNYENKSTETLSYRDYSTDDVKDSKIKDTQVHTAQHIRQIQSFTTSFQLRKHSRKDQILALFVKGVDISIKDISTRIKGCSEKTIQRELNDLVSDGKIQRIGEKRWSRYILK